jgi:hypothetical protein
LQGAEHAHFDGAFANCEHGGGVSGGKLLEVAEDEDFPVALGESIECGTEPGLPFGSAQPRAGAALLNQNSIGQLEHRLVGDSEGLLALDASPAGAQVSAMSVDQTFASQLSEPGVKGEWAFFQVLVEALIGGGERFLNDIGRIDAGGKPAIESNGDELAESAAMPMEQSFAGRRVALGCVGQQAFRIGFGLRRHHQKSPKSVPRSRSEKVTGNSRNRMMLGEIRMQW